MIHDTLRRRGAFFVLALPLAAAIAQYAPPAAPVRDQVDTWHGVAVHDPRVDAWNSAKTAARMQAASTSGKPILLRVDAQDGHGVGRTPAQGRSIGADTYSFLLWQMKKRQLAAL